ncbi:MAG: hypothetical protein JXB88_14160 [Spirochaetales bacterium]|nr:hypothetical protein [Spirochaetales bacterium]
MKQSIQTIIKIILLALIGLILFFYFLPVTIEIPQDILHPKVTKDKDNEEDVETKEIILTHPNNVAVLFGWVIPVPTPTPRVTPVPTLTPVPTPITPVWLKFTGIAIVENVKYYLFKDDRYNTPIKVAKGVPDKGWYFVNETSNGFQLKKDGENFFVPKTR